MNVKGFTLIELMVTLAVIAIVTGFALPSFQHVLATIDAKAQQDAWVDYLTMGRETAVTYASNVTACPFIEGKCSDDLNATWTMFTDANDNRILDNNELIIRQFTPDEDSSFVVYRRDRPYFRFYNQTTGIYSGLMKSITICPTGKPDQYASHISVNIMGRIGVNKKRDTEGVPLRKDKGRWVTVTC